MTSDTAAAPEPILPSTRNTGVSWGATLWIGGIHLGALAAPFVFSWSGLLVFFALYVVTGLGITLGYHRLLTHRSFHTNKFVEYLLTLCGILANEGGPLRWAATHRRHHTHSDEEDDPHSPTRGMWWAHVGWWMHRDPVEEREDQGYYNVKDLIKDPVQVLFQRFHWLFPILLAGLLYGAGELLLGEGLSWLVWGVFARSVFVYHTTWLVNSATHIWGYRNFNTTDRSRNLWWVAALTFGEGWHNNHHAHQRSARHGLRWWEVDVTYMVIRAMAWVGLARDIHVAPKPNAKPGSRKSVWRILWPLKNKNRLLRK